MYSACLQLFIEYWSYLHNRLNITLRNGSYNCCIVVLLPIYNPRGGLKAGNLNKT